MNFYEGPIATIITAVAFIGAAVCLLLWACLNCKFPRAAYLFFRISFPLLLFGGVYYATCKVIEALDMSDLQGNIFIIAISVVWIGAQLIPNKKSKR